MWTIAGVAVLLAALPETPARIAEIRRGYGVQDAWTMLAACAVAALAGVGGLVAGARWWWHGRGAHWPEFPAMALFVTGVGFSWGRGLEDLLQSIVFFASIYALVYLGALVLLAGVLSTAAVSLVDKGIELLVARRAR